MAIRIICDPSDQSAVARIIGYLKEKAPIAEEMARANRSEDIVREVFIARAAEPPVCGAQWTVLATSARLTCWPCEPHRRVERRIRNDDGVAFLGQHARLGQQRAALIT
jgi:hypothetical protein